MKKISPASVNWQSTFMRWIAVINCCNCLGKKKTKKIKRAGIFHSFSKEEEKSHATEPQPVTLATLASKDKRRFACRRDRDHLVTI